MAITQKPADQPELKPAREHRVLPLDDVEWRASGSGEGELTVRGHAAVFNRSSLDLGGFRETIDPHAFDNVLDTNPDVHALWDHDTRLVLARTTNKTLELRADPIGLHFWAKVANTSYAKDLRLLMERGDVNQASFAFTVARDEWTVDDKEQVTRTILEVDQLYDVTVTAQGAYPQTDTSVVKHLRSRISSEIDEGNLPNWAAKAIPNDIVAPDDPADESQPHADSVGSDDQRTLAPSLVEDNSGREAEEKRADDLKDLRKLTEFEVANAKRRLLDAERKRN
jgi:HK97 family phage prohead protease